MPKEWMRILRRITLVTQLGFSLVTPPVLLVLLALWIQKKTGAGDWLLLLAILTGVLAGISSAWQLLRAELAHDRRAGGAHTEKGDSPNENRSGR